jgi:hypothetical protein
MNGVISEYAFYVSADGSDWGAPVASGVFANDTTEKEIYFAATVGKFVRLVALSEVNGNPWTSAAEINVLGKIAPPSYGPFNLMDIPGITNPVLTAADVTDFDADFVADPFLYYENSTWYMFFEALIPSLGHGAIGFASSYDGLHWDYEEIVLSEDFHLSHPLVLKHNGHYYMVCETYQIGEVRVYETSNFPYDWTYVSTLVSGRPFVDPSIFRYNDKWWMFVAGNSNSYCYLYYSDDLLAGWVEHPMSPIVTADASRARPGGRTFIYDYDRIIRPAQKANVVYGEGLRAFEIDILNETQYAEHEIPESPLIFASGSGWNATGMHHLDPWWTGTKWLCAVDGQDEHGRWSIGIYSTPPTLAPNGVIDLPSTDITIHTGDWVNFGGSGSDPDNSVPLMFLWQFGTGSGIPDSVQEDPGLTQFNIPGTYSVTFSVTDAHGFTDPSPATRTITVLPVTPTIPQTGWNLVYVDSEELLGEGEAAVNAFDGDVTTIWHTEWIENDPPPPHEIQIDLGALYEVDGFYYLPRQDGGKNGRINQYAFYVSADGADWGDPVASGAFANNALEKGVFFVPQTAQFVRLVALSEVNGNPWTTMAELNILGVPTNVNPPVITSLPITEATQGELYSYDVEATDFDPGDTLSYVLDVAPEGMSIDPATGLITWTPNGAQAGDNSVTVTVYDNGRPVLSDSQNFTITVENTNDAPVITSIPVTGAIQGELYSYDVEATDFDPGDTLSYSLDVAPDGMTIDPFTGVITWIPAEAQVGDNSVTVTVFDDGTPALSGNQSFTVTVSAVIPQALWSLVYVDSEEVVGEDGAGVNAFDGDTTTLWHTEWSAGDPPPPHEIQINLGSLYKIGGFRYLPRQDGGRNGRIGEYAFYVSTDISDWGVPVATGIFANDATEKEVSFAPVLGQFVRLVALSEVNGNPWTTMAEINILGIQSTDNYPPNGTIMLPSGDVAINAGDWVDFSGIGSDPDNDLPLSFLWQFGAGSGIADSVDEDPGLVQFNSPGIYTVTFTVSDALGITDPTPATRTVNVTSISPIIPQSSWSLIYVDSEEVAGEDGAAVNAFDGDVTTLWHTEWKVSDPPPPHEIQINLGGLYAIDGFYYLPRQDGGVNGRIKEYAFYVSTDGSDWGAPVATGIFTNDAVEKQVSFMPILGQFVRLIALSEVNGNPWTTIAEINILGAPSDNSPPNGTIILPSGDMTISAGDSVDFSGVGSDPDNDLPLSFLWQFGAGSGIADLTDESPGIVQFDNPGIYTVTFTVTDALGFTDPTAATRTITVNSNSSLIPQSGWSLVYVDSEELVGEDGAAVNAFDGDVTTIWHTEWMGSDPPPAHEIQIDLGSIYTIDGFRYLPRQDGGINGRIKEYALYMSVDGSDWGAPVAIGLFANDATEKQVFFAPKTGQFFRLVVLSEVNNNPWTTVAEINILGY